MSVAVVGAGLVGSGWAIVFARAGHEVAIYDAKPAAAAEALKSIEVILPQLVERGLLREAPAEVLKRLRLAEGLADACAEAAYVQESGPERLAIKQEMYRQLEAAAGPETILASSSSGITASQFAGGLETRARCIVAHPVNPPYLVPVVEIVPAPWTDPAVAERTRQIQAAAGQVPVVLRREIEGFVLNRLQGALLHEAFRLVEDGVASPEDIDKTVRDGLGLRWSFMGPFETIDLNAPGGVRDYVERLGPLYLDLAEQRGAPRPWGEELVDAVEHDRRRHLAAGDLQARTAWRDRMLMALLSHKLGHSEDDETQREARSR